ncbi:hypothetical protein V5F90_03260 [Priestia aryabhattai]
MEHRVYVIENQYLVEIDYEKNVGSMNQTLTWTWELSIASKGEEYQGKAKDLTYGNEINWTPLLENNLSEELINKCKKVMHRHYNF